MFDGFGNRDSGVRCSAVTAGNICDPNGQSPLNDLIFTIDALSGQTLAVDGFLAFDVARVDTGATGFATVTLASTPVPEPATLTLIGSALVFLGAMRRRRSH